MTKMQTKLTSARIWMMAIVTACALMACAWPASVADADPRDDASPWGVGSSAEWSGEFPKFDPLLNKAGATWLRLFAEWQVVEPRKGQFDWAVTDRMVAAARENHLHVTGFFGYCAPWASAKGDTRTLPLKDIQDWRDYVRETVMRYKKDIKYWEIWNEFNGSFSVSKNKPRDYADLVVAAYDEAKKADPDCKIIMSCANFDVGFFDLAIKAGAANHFDVIAVHPYENLAAVMNGEESGYLSMAGSLRKMLADNGQRADVPLWVNEVGLTAPVHPEPKADARQAEGVVKAYALSLAQGFQRLFWFEARGPSYGHGEDFGLIREDWSLRPSYDAYALMTGLLGQEPKYLGWLKAGDNGYGFVFQGHSQNALIAWSPPAHENKIKFDGPVRIIDLAGKETALAAGEELTLTRSPLFIVGLPVKLAELAQSQANKPFPWGTDYSKVDVVSCRLGATNDEKGIKQISPQTTAAVNDLSESWRRSNFKIGGEGRYVYFRVDPTFASFGNRDLEITIVARRVAPDKPAGFGLTYEALKGYHGADGYWTIPADDQWHEHAWTVHDANFVGGWGWNFRVDASGSGNEFYIKEARAKRLGADKQTHSP
jgi:hypothetical protein